MLLHAVATAKDPVDGAYTFRCGLRVWPLGGGDYDNKDGRYRATGLGQATCPGCQVKLKPLEKKTLRLIYQYPKRNVSFTYGARTFSWRSENKNELTIWCRRGFTDQLFKLGLLAPSKLYNVGLTYDGRSVAIGVPKVEEGDF